MGDHELRDRIESVVCRQTGCHIVDAGLAAQAVIDDLGLTVHEVDRGNATKYVTKWLHP